MNNPLTLVSDRSSTMDDFKEYLRELTWWASLEEFKTRLGRLQDVFLQNSWELKKILIDPGIWNYAKRELLRNLNFNVREYDLALLWLVFELLDQREGMTQDSRAGIYKKRIYEFANNDSLEDRLRVLNTYWLREYLWLLEIEHPAFNRSSTSKHVKTILLLSRWIIDSRPNSLIEAWKLSDNNKLKSLQYRLPILKKILELIMNWTIQPNDSRFSESLHIAVENWIKHAARQWSDDYAWVGFKALTQPI